MQTSTFLQKLASRGLFLRTLLPLLTLLTLGSVSSAYGQNANFGGEGVTFISQPTGQSTSSPTYAATKLVAPYNGYPSLGNSNTTPPSLGTFDINGNSSLKFDASSIVIQGASTFGSQYNPSAGQVSYRVYLTTNTPPATYTILNLPTVDNTTYASFPATKYSGSGFNVDLLAGLLGGGTYQVDFQFIGYITSTTNSADTKATTDPSNGTAYSIQFTVTPPAMTPVGGTTIWTSTSSTATGTDWLNPSNWSNGVPNQFSNAIIPDKTTDTSTPLLADPNATYAVRTLTLSGTSNSSRALLRIGQSVASPAPQLGATLRVYGDLNCFAGGILAAVSGTNGSANPATNSTVVLARNDGNVQTVRGSILSIQDIRIEGRGLKAIVATSFSAPNTLTFAPDAAGPGAIMRTAADNAPRNSNNMPNDNITAANADATFPLNTTQSSVVNLKDSGTIFGEVVGSYIQGILIADRTLSAGVKQTFGNIGIDITPNRNIPSPNVVVTRTTGDPLRGPVSNTGPASTGNPQPVKRQYGISGDINNNTTSDITFHYLNSADELNGNDENSLAIFKTANNAPPFSRVGRSSAVLGTPTTQGTVTVLGYSAALNTLTMSDLINPLPVSLVAFAVVRDGNNSLVSWATATEKDNKGFNVQVSTNGVDFHTLGYVASKLSNSVQLLSYQFTDVESGKRGTRYYRLEQVDLDGKTTYSPVRAVSFDGTGATSVVLVAYPNPFTNVVGLTLEGATINDGALAYVKILDMSGRTVSEQKLSVNGASLSLGDLSNLHSGLYLAKVTLPDGSTKTVRIQRQ